VNPANDRSNEYFVARVPADIDAPDRVLYHLTARQVAILAATGAVLWAAYHILTPLVPPIAVGIGAVPVAALAAGLALGRRDGISMDRWALAALATARAPRLLVAAGQPAPALPAWAPQMRTADPTARDGSGRRSSTRGGKNTGRRGKNTAPPAPRLAPLRLPADRVHPGGVVDLDGQGRVAVTAVSTVNFDLRSLDEQAALIEAAGRWLNSLSAPTQIVVSTRRVDMDAHADLIEAQLDYLPHPALAEAAAGYADFLRELGDERDPLDRRIVVAHRVGAGADPAVARRHAEHTARALSGLGVPTRVLDGGQITDVLAAACNPWQHTGSGRPTPDAVIAGPPQAIPGTE
jgi:hypothetical protein